MRRAKRTVWTYTIIQPDKSSLTQILNRKATLQELQSWTGGYIQIVQILPKQWIVVNEEGMINGMKLNPTMTWQGQPLYGPIVLLPRGCRV